MEQLDMRQNQTPGLLITFCGLDGSGKSTMMKRLIVDLEPKYSLFVTKQPTDAVRGSKIFRTYMTLLVTKLSIIVVFPFLRQVTVYST